MKTKLIAPCGMNCSLCIAHIREKNKCPGCNFQGDSNSDYCRKCSIKNCKIIKNKGWKCCSPKCEKFPCPRLKNLDKRYREKYGMSMIKNLEFIKDKGIRKFIKNEKQKWIKNDKIFCVHRNKYFDLK